MSEFHLIQGDLFPEPPREDRDIPGRYERGESIQQLADRCGIGPKAVVKILARAGTKMRRPGRLAVVRDDAFDTITPESAYWIGFLMADGCVSDPSGRPKRISLGLQERDASHVEAFRSFLNSRNTISISRQVAIRGGSEFLKHQFVVSSDALADALARYGVGPRKSLTARVVGLEGNRDFWRGVIDGDGHIREAAGGKSISVQLVGSEGMMRQFLDFVGSVYPRECGSLYRYRNVFRCGISGKAATAGRILAGPCPDDRKKWKGMTHDSLLAMRRELGSWDAVAQRLGTDRRGVATLKYRLKSATGIG
jgi:hypothetical protein